MNSGWECPTAWHWRKMHNEELLAVFLAKYYKRRASSLSGWIVAESVRQQGAGEKCTMRSFVLCFWQNIIPVIKSRKMKWAGRGGASGTAEVWWRRLRERRPLGRCWLTVFNIKPDIKEMGWECFDWINVAQDRDQWRVYVNWEKNLWITENKAKFWTTWNSGRFPWRTLHRGGSWLVG